MMPPFDSMAAAIAGAMDELLPDEPPFEIIPAQPGWTLVTPVFGPKGVNFFEKTPIIAWRIPMCNCQVHVPEPVVPDALEQFFAIKPPQGNYIIPGEPIRYKSLKQVGDYLWKLNLRAEEQQRHAKQATN